MERPIRSIFSVIVILFLISFLFLVFLRGVDSILQKLQCDSLNFVRLDGGVDSWFSFYGSYFGVFATVVLGVITLRMDTKIHQDELETQINGLTLKEMQLYDLEREFKPSTLVNDGNYRRFILKLSFDKFDPYYEIEVKKVMWGNENWSESLEVDAQCICVKKEKNMLIYLNFDDVNAGDVEKSINFFYRIRCFNSIIMDLKKRQRTLILKLCLNRKSSHGKEAIPVEIKITFENEGYREGCMLLKESNYLLEIKSF